MFQRILPKVCLPLSLAVLLGTGCASRPLMRLSNVEPHLPRLAPGKARVFIYRSDTTAPLFFPDIRLNGKVIGEAHMNSYFYVDLAPGDYTIETKTEVTNELKFKVAANERKYVEISVGIGLFMGRFSPELAEREEALEDLESLRYTGVNAESIERKLASIEEAKKE